MKSARFAFDFSSQEIRIGIGTVNSYMAEGAVLESRIEHVMRGGLDDDASVRDSECSRAVMAFETDRINNRAPQQLAVHRSVR